MRNKIIKLTDVVLGQEINSVDKFALRTSASLDKIDGLLSTIEGLIDSIATDMARTTTLSPDDRTEILNKITIPLREYAGKFKSAALVSARSNLLGIADRYTNA